MVRSSGGIFLSRSSGTGVGRFALRAVDTCYIAASVRRYCRSAVRRGMRLRRREPSRVGAVKRTSGHNVASGGGICAVCPVSPSACRGLSGPALPHGGLPSVIRAGFLQRCGQEHADAGGRTGGTEFRAPARRKSVSFTPVSFRPRSGWPVRLLRGCSDRYFLRLSSGRFPL